MTIASATAIPLAVPFITAGPEWTVGGSAWTKFTVVLVRIETHDGLVGWGEAFAISLGREVAAILNNHLLPKLIGRDETQIAAIKLDLERTMHNAGRIGPVHFGISGIDIALWDLAGKRAGRPLVDLLGGAFAEEVEVYASLRRYGADHVAPAIEQAIAEGYRHIKLHEVTVEAHRAAVAAAAGRAAIMADVNCAWDVPQALAMDRALAPLGLGWLEEPVWPPEDHSGRARVRRQGNHRIAAGENAGSLADFAAMIAMGSLDIAQPDVTKAGGVSEMMKIAALCEANGIELVPHAFIIGPGLAATVQINAALAHRPLLERFHADFEADILGGAMIPKRARLPVPTGPGHGCDPVPGLIERFRVE
jgi:L-alanine-DL-glutamate epimerase-like enolase superfamily enzyme